MGNNIFFEINLRKKMYLIIFLFGFSFCQKKIWYGTCPEVPLIKNFNLNKYGGTWYEAGRYSMKFQSDEARCGIVHYDKIDETTVGVNNSEIIPAKKGKTKRRYILGQAKQTDPQEFPNKL